MARNPVIDLNVMMGTSDITDWFAPNQHYYKLKSIFSQSLHSDCCIYYRVYVEGGVPFDKEQLLVPSVSRTEDADKLRNCSPINFVRGVECPVLLHLGTKDLRVPMSQGMAYYRALKSLGKVVE